MLIENEFSVPAPPEAVWIHLLDVDLVARCMPGAELTETVDDHTWKGRIQVKLGPVSLSFAGTVTIEERDDQSHRVVLHANGVEQRGKGAARSRMTSWLESSAMGPTTVRMQSDVTLTGTVAQLSRGLLPDVSRRLTQEFAKCLRASMGAGVAPAGSGDEPPPMAAPAGSAPAPPPANASAIRGIPLGLWAVWRTIIRSVRRLIGRT